jgi:hypothetical protein
MDAVNQAAHKLGAAVYKSTAKSGPRPSEGQGVGAGTGAGGKSAKDDDVIDAEFEVKN